MRVIIGVLKAILVFIFVLPIELLGAWSMMLWLGAAHGSFDERIPAFGYWTCFFLLWATTPIVTTALYAREISKAVQES